MPKEAKEEVKKKIVVVEEVAEAEETKNEEISDESQTPKVEEPIKATPVIAEVATEEEAEKTNYLWIIIPTALLIGALVGGLITYFSGISKLAEVELVPTPVPFVEPVIQATASPSSVPELDRSVIKLQVLNGSGISGEANSAKIFLESLGYKNVAIGNAPKTYTETTISFKDDMKEKLEAVGGDISKKYEVSEKTETLIASSKFDFVIYLGSK